MLTYEEIKKLNRAEIVKKISELKKDYFEKKQKLLRGEHKDISEFKKIKKTVARLLTVAATLPPEIIKTVKEIPPAAVLPEVKKAPKTVIEKKEKVVEKQEKEKIKTTAVKKEKSAKPVKKAVKKPVQKKKAKKRGEK